MISTATSVRERMAAASRRIGRLKRIDRAAVVVIALGGISVVVCVLGILVFVVAEAVPLFRPASLSLQGTAKLAGPTEQPGPGSLGGAGTDEYQRYLYGVDAIGEVVVHDLATGAGKETIPAPGLQGAHVTAVSRSVLGGYLAAATSDGRVSLMQIRFAPRSAAPVPGQADITIRDRGLVEIDPLHRPIRRVSYLDQEGRKSVAAVVDDHLILLWWSDENGGEHRASVTTESGDRATVVSLGRGGALAVGTDRGRVYHWLVDLVPSLTDVSPVGRGAVTALQWLIGGGSYVAGTGDGEITSWFRAAGGAGGADAMLCAHRYEPQSSGVVDIVPSPRDRSFATVGADGSFVLRHQTSERTLVMLAGGSPIASAIITPKADGVVLLRGASADRYQLRNPHPEISWRILFGKTWYEGYPRPEYVWQSSGATDDFESKMSLVPLVFGTIKGTLYAMLFAVPIAVLGALYTSQFVHPRIRAAVKPTVELMAALPSVVIGFLGGLYLASAVEKNLVGVFMMIPLLPIVGTSGVFLWRLLPRRVARRLKPGTELALIVPLLVLSVVLLLSIGPSVESRLFGVDARTWLRQVLGLTYDQRNCLVVGLAMGFAVVPIIFTISEDAFSSVPSNLTAASLALGASRWQTAVRVVLPTASPGVFSATMVGFGRAVGETMIVLMATGNTPLMDWSIFNGMRTLAANIAVEIPEAPAGGTLYRTLFLSAALLFAMTFVVNTLAELIRQRLRERFKAV